MNKLNRPAQPDTYISCMTRNEDAAGPAGIDGMSAVRNGGRRRLLRLSMMCAALAVAGAAWGADYPVRPLKLIVPYAPGAGTDTVARLVATKLAQKLGQTIVVENKAGASGNIGTADMARAAPDGYTLGVATPGPVSVGTSLYKRLPYDPLKDLQPVILLNESPVVMLVNPKVPATSVAAFMKWAKTKNGGANAAIAATGSVNHLATELFKLEAGVELYDVPYKGGAQALMDTIAGQDDVLFIGLSSVVGAIAAKQLIPLFVADKERNALLPEVPTSAQAGFPGVIASAWNGIVVPRGTPADVVEKLNHALQWVLQQPDVRQSMSKQGITPKGGSASSFQAFLEADAAKWKKVIADAKIQQM